MSTKQKHQVRSHQLLWYEPKDTTISFSNVHIQRISTVNKQVKCTKLQVIGVLPSQIYRASKENF